MFGVMKKKHVALIIIVTVLVVTAAATAAYLWAPEVIETVTSYFVKNHDNAHLEIEGVKESVLENNIVEPTSYQSFIQSSNGTVGEDQIIDIDMKRLTGLYKLLQKHYLWDIDYDAVYDAMATAMFDTLGDKYSYYVKAEDSEEYEEETTGKYGGLGFYFSKNFVKYQDPEKEDTLFCNISQVFPNTPSSRGGMLAGDMIIKIEGQDVTDLEATDCAKLMKGEIGTSVTITVKRKDKVFDLTLTREEISVPTVEYTMLDDHIAYMLILKFSPDTVNKVGLALSELVNQGMKGLIIDLRDNPGGDVEATLNIANYFISGKDLLTISYKDKSKNTVFRASKQILVNENIPLVCLINGGTASSAEILSSTLRDNGRATLVGTTSFGKGIMQVISPYSEGYASITTASFVPPSGNEIHKIGVQPDIVVDSIVVGDEERDIFKQMEEDKIFEKFVEKHPSYTKKNVAKFLSENKDCGIKPEVLQILIRNEYYLKMTYDQRPKADTWFDPQIKKALEILVK